LQKIKLKEFFASLKPKYLLGTTYTISLTFLESVIWPTIPKNNLDNCLILCDNLGYRRAMSEAGALHDIGARYFVLPVTADGAFHPKVWIAANEETVALLVGSGNLTQSGFMDNVELFWSTKFDLQQPSGVICEDLRIFLDGLVSLIDPNLPASSLAKNHIQNIQALLPAWDNNFSLPRFFSSFQYSGKQQSLPKEISSYGTTGKLYVASPYFGGNLEGYRLLLDSISPAHVSFCPGVMEEGKIDINLHKKHSLLDSAAIMQVDFCKKNRSGEHFKLYGHKGKTEEENWLYCGSANCTYPAFTGKNIEAGVTVSVSTQELDTFFNCKNLDTLPDYKKEDKTVDINAIPLIFAAFTSDGIQLSLPSNTPLKLPLFDVTTEYRVGVRRATAFIDKLFSGDKGIARIAKDAFDQEFPSSIFASPYLVIKGQDAQATPFSVTCIIDDINTLKASAREKSATRASSAASRGESPELADLVEYFNYIAGALNDGFGLNSTGRKDAVQGGDAGKETDRVAVWPPEPVINPSEVHEHISQGQKYYYYWLDRMLRVFGTKKTQTPPSKIEGAPEGDSTTEDTEGGLTATPREWKEAVKRADSITEKFKRLQLDINQANCVYPTAILTHLMLLSIRTSMAEDLTDPDGLMDSPANIAARMISTLFADRKGPFGDQEVSISEACYQEYQIPIYQQFAEDIISAFAQLFISGKSHFPINHWLKFRGVCGIHFELFISSADRLWDNYSRHYPWHEYGMSMTSFTDVTRRLKEKGWTSHNGFLAAREIIQSVQENRKIDENLLTRQAQANIGKLKRRIKRGLTPYMRVERLKAMCMAPKCHQMYITQASLGVLHQLQPAICESCGMALIPDVLFDIIEASCV